MPTEFINLLFLLVAAPSLMAYSLWLLYEGLWAHRKEKWEDRDHGGECLSIGGGTAGLIFAAIMYGALFLGRY